MYSIRSPAHLRDLAGRDPRDRALLPPLGVDHGSACGHCRAATTSVELSRGQSRSTTRIRRVDRAAQPLLEQLDHPPLLLDERVDPRRLGVEEVGDRALCCSSEERDANVAKLRPSVDARSAWLDQPACRLSSRAICATEVRASEPRIGGTRTSRRSGSSRLTMAEPSSARCIARPAARPASPQTGNHEIAGREHRDVVIAKPSSEIVARSSIAATSPSSECPSRRRRAPRLDRRSARDVRRPSHDRRRRRSRAAASGRSLRHLAQQSWISASSALISASISASGAAGRTGRSAG